MSNAENARRAMQVFGLGRSHERVKKAVGHINALEDERNALKKALEEIRDRPLGTSVWHGTFADGYNRSTLHAAEVARQALADLEEAQKA